MVTVPSTFTMVYLEDNSHPSDWWNGEGGGFGGVREIPIKFLMIIMLNSVLFLDVPVSKWLVSRL